MGKAVNGSVLVVGSGIAGMQAALDLADSGFYVHLVEKSPAIGGVMAQLDKTFPTNDCAMWIISPKLVEVGRHNNIELHTCAQIDAIDGEKGNFQVTLRKTPRYIDSDKCTACGDCADVCPVSRPNQYDTNLAERKATYKLYAQAIPGSFAIEKLDPAPCRMSCPANLNVQGYVAMVKAGKHREAVEIIMQDLPLPGVLGRICPHRCEKSCRRLELDEAVSIRELKRVAADHVNLSDIPVPDITPRKERVAIIGSGPAGLTAAYFLALDGYQVSIYEAMPEPGGMMRYGIPEHRLPRSVLDAEIDNLKRYGISIHTHTVVGRDVTIEELRQHGARAIFIAIGAWKGLKLRIPGEDASRGVSDVTSFLREVHLGNLKKMEGKVVVIGGGHSALDAARVSLRLGAAEAHIVYRRGREEMLAEPEEVVEAENEGVKIHFLAAPVAISEEGGTVMGIECIRTRLSDMDTTGRRKPIPIEGSNFLIEADHIIPAIGQQPDFDHFGDAHGLEISQWDLLSVHPETLQTNVPDIFGGGDAVTGPATVIEAVEAGKRAAKYMARYIRGEELPIQWQEEGAMGQNWTGIPRRKPDDPKQPRMAIPTLPVEQRVSSFDEVNLMVDEQTARQEAARCLDCGGCCECFQCVKVCEADAVTLQTHAQQPETICLDVGSVVLSPGFQPFDPSRFENYAYAKHPNVVTSIEFERILSATGPTQGRLTRVSDQKEPKKVAWFQCIGSRDVNRCDNPHCSSVCCMYAIKEAVIAKEHSKNGLDCAVFFMDMRTHGKDFEKYFNDARDKHGVRFIRSRVHTIDPVPGSDDLQVRYVSESGELKSENFDMIVLSVGMQTDPEMVALAKKLNLSLSNGNFCKTEDLKPCETSRDGIYVCGAFRGPKDIPESVMDASAAACGAGMGLASARGELVREKEFPAETDVAGQEPRIGVFVCNCGVNIGGFADVPAIADYAKTLPGVMFVEENLFTCSQDTQDKMVEVIGKNGLNRIVVAACTPRTHEPLFQETMKNSGLNPYLFEMANIRNQCTWVHSHNKEKATKKAKDLVKMAVARASLLDPIEKLSVQITKSALVIGGGVAGMTAALSLAEQGYPTTIVEKSSVLGGKARDIATTWQGEDVKNFLTDMENRVNNHPDIEVLTDAEVTGASGFIGNFETEITANGFAKTVSHGVAIIATGAEASDSDEYLYGKTPRVTRWHDLEHNPEKLENAESIVFIQCVGSRDDRRPYCSRICCTASVKQAIAIKEKNPDAAVYVLYREIRTYGEREALYKKARQLGVIFIRYALDRKPRVAETEEGLEVTVFDPILQRDLLIKADLVNLATAIVPSENNKLASMFKLPLNPDRFFMEAHAKLRPVDFATDGIFLCGLAHYPKSMDESIAQAMAAAGKATTVLSRDSIQVSPLVSQVDEEKCIGCGLCAELCPFNAIELEEIEGKGFRARNIPASCKGCGLCASSCPRRAIDMLHFRNEQIVASVCAMG